MHKTLLIIACFVSHNSFAMEESGKTILPPIRDLDNNLKQLKNKIEFYKFKQLLSIQQRHQPPLFDQEPPSWALKPLAKKLIDQNKPQTANDNIHKPLKIPLQQTNLKKNIKISLNPGAFTNKIRRK